MSMVEGGITPARIHFVRETVEGEFPTDPTFLRYSDSVMRFAPQPDVNIFNRRPVGAIDVAEAHPGPEDHVIGIDYHLQKALTEGDDAAADFLLRASDNDLLNTHGIVARQEFASGGAIDGAGFRVYDVIWGGQPSQVQIQGNPEDGEPVMASLEYRSEKYRQIIIHQPDTAATVTVVSTSASDTTQSVTIESEGAAESETLSLNGTTEVDGATSFSDIDAIYLDADMVGDLVVSIGGTEICRILGRESLSTGEGDLGVPLLGSGSMESAIGTAFENFLDETVTYDGGAIETDGGAVLGLQLQVSNNFETTPRIGTRRKRYNVGVRDIEVTATVFGKTQSHEDFLKHLQVTAADFVWTLDNSTITVQNAVLETPGERVIEAEGAIMQRDNTFTGQGISIS